MNWSGYLDANQSQFVDEILELISIPSVSGSSSRSIAR